MLPAPVTETVVSRIITIEMERVVTELSCPRCRARTVSGRCRHCGEVPNPGSLDAATLGCSCPRIENCHGRGAAIPRKAGLDPREHSVFWVNPGCILHGEGGSAGWPSNTEPAQPPIRVSDRHHQTPPASSIEQFLNHPLTHEASRPDPTLQTHNWTEADGDTWWADDSEDMIGLERELGLETVSVED